MQVRSVDLIAAVLALLLGAFSVADVLAVNLRDRAGEQAVLAATAGGRQPCSASLSRRMVVGVVGAVAGGAVGFGLAAILTGTAIAVLPAAVLAALIGLLLVGAVLMVLRGRRRTHHPPPRWRRTERCLVLPSPDAV